MSEQSLEAIRKAIEQASYIAKIIGGVDPETILIGEEGVTLTSDQLDKLLTEVFANGHRKGYDLAITRLKAESEKALVPGPDYLLDRWAIFQAAAALLTNKNSPTTQKNICACLCQLGKDCGGCGHDTCNRQNLQTS